MKKLLYAIILITFFIAGPVYAETCTFDGSTDQNWWTAANWTCSVSGDKVPAAGDDVVLNASVVVWNPASGARIPATSGSLGTITSSGVTGQISIDISAAGCNGNACSITATTITAGTKPTTGGIILISGTTANTLAIGANIVGGSNSSSYGVNHTGTGAVTITGTVTGGSGASSHGAVNTSTGVLNISGNVTGGSGAGSWGFYNLSTGTGTITGNVQGGSASSASGGQAGVNCYGAGQYALVGNLIDTQYGMAWYGKPPTWTTANAASYHQLQDATKLYADTDPGVANVKSGTTYYFQSGTIKTGTLAGSGGGAWGF